MSNWFKKSQGLPKARWSFSIEAYVWVPDTGVDEEEKGQAQNVLRAALDRVEGDASSYTGIDSNIKFDIQFEPLKIR